MKAVVGRSFPGRFVAPVVAVIAAWALLGALPVLGQDNASDAASMPIGTVFRWLNFILVFGVLAYAIGKFGAPYFRGQAQNIARSIEDASQNRSAAEREFQEAAQKLATIQNEIEQERRAAERESAADRARIRTLTQTEIEKIGQSARAEIAAAERAGAQELRAIGARLATERAARLIREQMNDAAEAALFEAFVSELDKVAS